MSSTATQKASAWSVHGLTLTGLIWACLALAALIHDQPKLMWLYLGIALIADAADGPLARKFDVRSHAAGIDGSILDIVIDYLTWTLIPALFLYKAGLMGGPFLGMIMLMLICISSMFCYANVGMKTDDYYFMGFPAAWNIVAICVWLLQPPLWLTIAVIVFLSLLTLAPITFLHPFRVERLRVPNIIAVAIWSLCMVILVITYPERNLYVEFAWWCSGVWIVGSGLLGGILVKRSQAKKVAASA